MKQRTFFWLLLVLSFAFLACVRYTDVLPVGTEEEIRYWLPYLTIVALGLALLRQARMESRFSLSEKATFHSNAEICAKLIQDMLGIHAGKSVPYGALKVLHSRVEGFLVKCCTCCDQTITDELKDKVQKFGVWEVELSRRAKSSKLPFSDDKFRLDLQDLRNFLTKETILIPM